MSTQMDWQAEIDSDDEDLEDQARYDKSKDATIWCIESTKSLLAPIVEEGKPESSILLNILKIALKTVKRKVITSGKDKIGIIIFNTVNRADTPGHDWENIYLLQDLEQVDVPMIQNLKTIVAEAEADPAAFADRFRPQDGDNVLPMVFNACNDMHKTKAANYASTRLFYFTDNDTPFPVEDSAQVRASVRTRANDLHEMENIVVPFFISPPDRPFDAGIFYTYVLEAHVDFEEGAGQVLHVANSKGLNEIYDQVKLRQAVKRSQFAIPFILGENLVIGINGYSLVNETKKQAAVQVDTNSREIREVKSVISYDDMDDGKPLKVDRDIKPYFPVGGKGHSREEKVVFNTSDIAKVKTIGMPPSLRLLGFTTLDRFAIEHQVKHAYFIYPTDKFLTGSLRAFASLLATMAAKDKVGLGLFLGRKGSTPVHVLIVPQEEELSDIGGQLKPPGMHLIQLAFADDIRTLDLQATVPCATDADAESPGIKMIAAMKKAIVKLRKAFDPDEYPNPDLNFHFDCLQAIALNEELPVVADETLPLYQTIKERAGPIIEEFKSLAEDNPQCKVSVPGAKAPTTKAAAGGTKRKKAEVDDAEDAGNAEERIAKRFKEGTESKFTVAELKDYCRSQSLALGGKKADLIERIKENLDSKDPSASGVKKEESASDTESD